MKHLARLVRAIGAGLMVLGDAYAEVNDPIRVVPPTPTDYLSDEVMAEELGS